MGTKNVAVTTTVGVSAKDKRIVLHLANGLRTKDIADTEGINQRTLESQIDELKKVFLCKTVPHLVATFIRNKVIE